MKSLESVISDFLSLKKTPQTILSGLFQELLLSQNTSNSNTVLMTLLLWQAGPEFGSQEVSVCAEYERNGRGNSRDCPTVLWGSSACSPPEEPLSRSAMLVLPSHPHFLKTPH